jgi:hypothetical protein
VQGQLWAETVPREAELIAAWTLLLPAGHGIVEPVLPYIVRPGGATGEEERQAQQWQARHDEV